MWTHLYKVVIVLCGMISVGSYGYSATPISLENGVEHQVAQVQTSYLANREIKHHDKYTKAFQVKIELRNAENSLRSVTHPGVLVGARHMMVYLGNLKRGERIKHIAVEEDMAIINFVGAYNNVWKTELELYNSLYEGESDEWQDVVLLLTLPYEVTNTPVAVVGLENTLSARTGFERSITELLSRWVNMLGHWDALCVVSLKSIHFIADVPQYVTSRPGSVHAAGQPLFAYFVEGNALGIPSYRKVLVGFKKSGYATYWGFSGWHMTSGKQIAPEVEFLSFK